MKKLLTLFLLFPLIMSAQTQTIVEAGTLDTLVITTSQKSTVIKVATVKDSTVTSQTVTTVRKPYKPSVTNQPPVARAGNDFTVIIPAGALTGSTQLNGSNSTDPEGAALKFFWRKVSGPAATLTDTNKVICIVSNMVEGVYDFELRAVDPLNAFTSDRIIVTVKKDVVTPPVGSVSPFSFTKNTAFKRRNFAGTENWNGQFYTSFAGGYNDYYFRFVWTDIEKVSQGNYVWTRFDQEFRKAIAVRGKFSFGIFMLNDSDDFLSSETFGSGKARYPKYIHDAMQASIVKDYVTNGQWVPAWNNSFMLDRYDALLKAVADHIKAMGWQDLVNYVDIRGYGQWGEWHLVNITNDVNTLPSGIRPTSATYKRFIDAHIKAFPDYPLVMLLAALDAEWLWHTKTPLDVTYYALTARNNFGLIGIRRDQWGATDEYIKGYMENNTRSYNGIVFRDLIMVRWKVAPLVGEPMGPGSNLSDLTRQVTFYHAASVGNGNYTADATSQNYFRSAENAAGYKLAFISGSLTTRTNGDFDISLTIENFGNTPCYEKYDLVYELRNSTGAVVWTGTSTWRPLLKLPGTHTVNDHYVVSQSANGLTLFATIKNSYRTMPLFNNGQNGDGSIVLKAFSNQ